MTTKELIQAEIDKLSDEELDELYNYIKGLTRSRGRTEKPGILSRLQEIKIDAPEDFAANLDLYLSGEKSADQDTH